MTEKAETGDGPTIGRIFHLLARGWWLIVAFVVLGVVVGAAVSYLSPKTSEATAVVYLGQPTDANGNPISGISANPKAALSLAGSNDVLSAAARRAGAGVTTAYLRTHATMQTPTATTGSTTARTNFVSITVRDTRPARASAAANAVADVLVDRLSAYSAEKIDLFEQEIAAATKRLTTAASHSAAAQRALETIAASSMSSAERAVASAPYLTIIQAAEDVRQQAEQQLQTARLNLTVAKGIESPSVTVRAVPGPLTRPSLRLDILVGGLVGLVAGCVAALLWYRRSGSAPDAA